MCIRDSMMGLGAGDFSEDELGWHTESPWGVGVHLLLYKRSALESVCPGAFRPEHPSLEPAGDTAVSSNCTNSYPYQVTPLDEMLGFGPEAVCVLRERIREWDRDAVTSERLLLRQLRWPLRQRGGGAGWLGEVWARLHRIMSSTHMLPFSKPAASASIEGFYANRWGFEHKHLMRGSCLLWATGNVRVDPALHLDGCAKSQVLGEYALQVLNSQGPGGLQIQGLFDVVVVVNVLGHARSPESLLGLLSGVIKPFGHLLLSTALHQHAELATDWYRPTTYGVQLLCERAGFKLLERDFWGNPLVVMARLANMGVGDLTEGELLATHGHVERNDDESVGELRHRYYKVSTHLLVQKGNVSN
eukprot:TRINITY_DN61810_c0_g1_i1.p1 TRINITY_DN61810_c0_g1~~TRINITY_DN61810_c0_g1_i1.p1  ORF type:complete len:360 (+),score=46.30 TRINITY_DN61810_c0_g1_i1:89-1168(+)